MLRTKGCCKAHGFIKGEISVPGAENFSFEQMKLNENKNSLSKHGTDTPERNRANEVCLIDMSIGTCPKNVLKSIYKRLKAFWRHIVKLFTRSRLLYYNTVFD